MLDHDALKEALSDDEGMRRARVVVEGWYAERNAEHLQDFLEQILWAIIYHQVMNHRDRSEPCETEVQAQPGAASTTPPPRTLRTLARRLWRCFCSTCSRWLRSQPSSDASWVRPMF